MNPSTVREFAAGCTPGLDLKDLRWQTLRFGPAGDALAVHVPEPTAGQLLALAKRVRESSQAVLKDMGVSQIIALVDAAVARLLDARDPYRQQLDALLPRVTGFDAEMVRLGLSAYLKTFRAPQLQRFVAEDFANPKVLDEFQPRAKGGFAKALGPDVMAHVWAGNVPGLPLWSLISGLLVKAGHIGKVASAEPVAATLFARLLVEIEPQLADCLAIVWWRGGDVERERALFGAADLVVAYGGNDTLSAVRNQVPITTRFLRYGHKLSFGMVARSALDARKAQRVAQLAALDVARYDQQGCYSPQLFYVERDGKVSPQAFAQYLSAELANLEHKYPRRALALEEATSVAQWRQSLELKSFSQDSAQGDVQLIGNAAAAWQVSYNENEGEHDAALAPSALNRSIAVIAVNELANALPQIARQRHYLQTVGLAAAPKHLFELSESLGRAGVTRVCAIGAMTAPEAGWHHDGRFNLLDLVHMVEIEQSAESAAETFAPYQD